MTEKRKNLVKGIIVILVFIAIMFAMDKVLMLKSEDGIEQMRSFYKQNENSIDVLFIGSSKVYCQIDTGILWDNHGIASFDLGGAEAPSWVLYYYLKEALKTQKPKVIMFETTIAGYRQDVLEEPEVWAITNNYGFKVNENRLKQLKDNSTKQNFYKLLLPLGSIHSNYNKITKDDFIDSNNSINYKGFDSRETVVPMETPDMSSVTECEPVNEKHIIYIDKMIELCKENDIPFIVMVSPYGVTEEEQRYFNYIFNHCEEMNVPYIDFNKMYDELELDFSMDMAERVHLNLSGSRKWTEYLGKYLKDNFELEDHRGDVKYISWDQDALWNRQDRLRYRIQNSGNNEGIFGLLNNENYYTFVTFGKYGSEFTEDDYNLNAILNLGADNITKDTQYVLNNGNIVFSSKDEAFSKFIDENDIKISFKRKESEDDAVLFVNENKCTLSRFDKETVIIYDRVLKKIVHTIVIE